jgi:rRNA biogenesis protein RRP36
MVRISRINDGENTSEEHDDRSDGDERSSGDDSEDHGGGTSSSALLYSMKVNESDLVALSTDDDDSSDVDSESESIDSHVSSDGNHSENSSSQTEDAGHNKSGDGRSKRRFLYENGDRLRDASHETLGDKVRERDKLEMEHGVGGLKDQRVRKAKALSRAQVQLKKYRQTKGIRTSTLAADACESKSLKRPAEKDAASGNSTKKKKSKHAPTEMSSKRSAFFEHQKTHSVVARMNESGIGVDLNAHRYKPADPRASSLSGHIDADTFDRRYQFVEEIRQKEIARLKQRLQAHQATGKRGQKMRKKLGMHAPEMGRPSSLEQDKAELQRLQQEQAAAEREKVDRLAKRSVKRDLQNGVATGKHGIYYPKRAELHRMTEQAKQSIKRERDGVRVAGDRHDQSKEIKRRKKQKSRDANLFAGR